MKKAWIGFCLAFGTCSVWAGELDDLIRHVRDSQIEERRIDEERKTRFLADRNQQQKLLADTKAALAKAEADSKALRDQYSGNQTRLKELNAELKSKSGELDSLFGSVRSFSAKLESDLESSITSAQFFGRGDLPQALAIGSEIPKAAQLEALWASTLEEMTESGKAVKYRGRFTDAAGQHRDADIFRLGVFSAIADNKYLRYVPSTGHLEESARQPGDDLLSLARNLVNGQTQYAMIAIDPTRGTLLEGLPSASAAPKWVPGPLKSLMTNEVDIGVIGLLLLASIWAVSVAFERWLYYRRVDVSSFPTQTALETDLTRHLTVIGTVAANAPFVGLLGTVLGIMMTFHKMGTDKGMDVFNIMLGLSVALKATAMGLLVAIPCVVMNNVLRRRIREMVATYEVQRGS